MEFTISHNSALNLLRAARIKAGEEKLSIVSDDFTTPKLDDGQSWTSLFASQIKQELSLPEHAPLDLLADLASHRVHVPGVRSRVWGAKAKGLWFMRLDGSGVTIPKPEVLLAQMAEELSLPELVALGHELCGCYSLRPNGSRGSAVTGIPAVTSVSQVRCLLKQAKQLRGSVALRRALPYLRDGSLSPQETALSTIVQLPTEWYGYQAGSIDLNEPVRVRKYHENAVRAAVRVPDILFRGTKVGINYDGRQHVDLPSVIRAAQAVGREPTSSSLAKELEEAAEAAYEDVASDKQRDRDLTVMGYTVLPITKEDLADIDALDRAMRQVYILIERTTGRDMGMQRRALNNEALKEGRKELLDTLRLL